ncbi:MAG: hypothetical protein CVV47_10845 [Spirochaetae bacterium HGW-Spirochaetae-3]|nr:MAG: hypothetical protein CVV47_10845 [Spirochaetae bacterium HGW-Spirochaetae-3]
MSVRIVARRIVALAASLVLAAFVASAQDRDVVMRAEFPVDLAPPPSVSGFDGVPDPAFVARVPDGEAAAALLEEARWTFAGMIWGFEYVYTPSDKARSVAELFEIRPMSPESSASMTMHAVAARLEGTVLYATAEFYPDAGQRAELASWRLSSATGQGRGSAPALRSGSTGAAPSAVEARRDAIVAAVREALRANLREVTHNKPREVRGTFALASAPRLMIKEGSWIASVRIYARVDEIIGYGAY